MVRATTGGVLKSYRYNLMNSFISSNKARETVLTQRVFNSYAEDPAAAAKSFRLRKSRMMTSSQLSVCQDTYYTPSAGVQCLLTIDELIDTTNGKGTAMTTLKGTTQEMLNDPKGDARVQLTKVLDQLSDTIVQNLNQTYGDDFIFAGADGQNVPFTVEEVNGVKKLFYRGVSVDATPPGAILTDAATGNNVTDANGNYVMASSPTLSQAEYNDAITAGEGTNDFISYKASDGSGGTVDRYVRIADAETMSEEDYNKAKTDAEKLDYLMNEKRFVDIGLGFQEDENGKLIESSAFNDALNGLTFLGYGMDEDGDPKNIYSIIQKLKGIAESVPDEGTWSADVYEDFRGLVSKLEDASSNFKTEFTNMDAGTQKLKNNMSLLEDNVYSLKEQYSNIEDVNMADAITSFIWAEYCYNAALKVGNSILSQSLMDYLN